jgi:hypothetical protein
MNYPIRILPQNTYREIDCDLSPHYLIRFTNICELKDLIHPETGFIRQEHICSPRKHASDLSTSLLGVFERNHVYIQLTEIGKSKFNHYCSPDHNSEIPIFNLDFEINKSRHFWVIKIKHLIEAEVNYLTSELPFTAISVVKHTPMKWNYWHFSIRWMTKDGLWHELSEKEKERLAKRLGSEVRAYISKYAIVEEPTYEELDPIYYTKGFTES